MSHSTKQPPAKKKAPKQKQKKKAVLMAQPKPRRVGRHPVASASPGSVAASASKESDHRRRRTRHWRNHRAYLKRHEHKIENALGYRDVEREPASSLPDGATQYLRSLQDPKEQVGAKVPYHINNQPTKRSVAISTAGFTTLKIDPLTDPTKQTKELAFFYGYCDNGNTGSVVYRDDDIAHLSPVVNIGAVPTGYIMGPVEGTGAHPCAAGVATNMALGSAGNNLTSADSVPLEWGALTPFEAVNANGTQVRWRCVSMEVSVQNVTKYTDRGGNIVSMLPANIFQSNSQSQASLSSDPTFTQWGTQIDNGECDCGGSSGQVMGAEIDHELGCRSASIRWYPRAQDIAFWTYDSAQAQIESRLGGMFIWLNNTTDAQQTYYVHYTYNWELAGVKLRTLTTPAINEPETAEYITPSFALGRDLGAGADVLDTLAVISKAAQDTGYSQYLHKALGLIGEEEYVPDVKRLVTALLPDSMASVALEALGVFF
jgi:hypothetical protein